LGKLVSIEILTKKPSASIGGGSSLSVVLALFLGATGCRNTEVADNTGKDKSISNTEEAIISGGGINVSKVEGFDNIAELKKNAEEIVYVKVLSSETEDQSVFPITITEAEVLNVIEGNLVKGDIIKLFQTGAIVDGQDVSIMGDPIYRTNEEFVLFLKKRKVSMDEDTTYRSLGLNDGRFDVKNTKIIARGLGSGNESTPKDKKKVKKSDSIAEMNYSDITKLGYTVEEFIQKIKEVKE
jgi:hypothetical protein